MKFIEHFGAVQCVKYVTKYVYCLSIQHCISYLELKKKKKETTFSYFFVRIFFPILEISKALIISFFLLIRLRNNKPQTMMFRNVDQK